MIQFCQFSFSFVDFDGLHLTPGDVELISYTSLICVCLFESIE